MSKSVTYGEVFDLYLSYASSHCKSIGEIRRIHKRYLRHLEQRSLKTISRLELQRLHTDIGNFRGKTAANRAIEQVSAVINKAIDWDLFDGKNPASRIQKYRMIARERFLKAHEIFEFFRALDGCRSQTMRDFIYICLFTGARSGNVMAMRWTEIDFHDKTWRIPDSKNGTPYTVPLIDPALEILRRRFYTRASAWVFPSDNNPSITIRNPRKTWGTICAKAGIEDLRIHDLRRSLASWSAMTGTGLPIIGKMLNHRDPQSTAIYARLDLTPVRAAIETAVTAIMSHRKAG